MVAESIYLDHNATSPMLGEVAQAISECHALGLGNPASSHFAGRHARSLLEQARTEISGCLGAQTDVLQQDRLILTSGGTESNNLALRGLAGKAGGRIIVSAIEHPSVMDTCEALGRSGFDIRKVHVSGNGVIDLDHLRSLINQNTRLISIMLGNNETGVIQPVQEVAAIAGRAGIPVHTDAIQVVGKLAVDFQSLGVAALSFSAHKFHGPPGAGGLLLRGDLSLRPLMHGGFQQFGLRPGTECVALTVGMNRALQVWKKENNDRIKRLRKMRDLFENILLSEAGSLPLVVHGAHVPRLPHTTCISFVGMESQILLMAFDVAGVSCSNGSACASGSSEPSHVLLAMSCDEPLLRSAVRFSFGVTNTDQEAETAARRILFSINELRNKGLCDSAAGTSREMPAKSL